MDRNLNTVQIVIVVVQSLSARRAWIEIVTVSIVIFCIMGRSPQGERG